MDKKRWHIYARLVCEHQQQQYCARPQWVRVMVLWHESFAEKLDNSRFWQFIHWLFPSLIGGMGLMCANCQMTAFQSKWAETFRKVIGFLTGWSDGDPEAVLIVDDDVYALSDQTREKLNVEDV